MKLDNHTQAIAELHAIAYARESTESQPGASRRHPLAKFHTLEVYTINAVTLASICVSATYGSRLPDPDRSPDAAWNFHLGAVAHWRYCMSLLDASIEYAVFFGNVTKASDTFRKIAMQSDIKCPKYASFFDAAIDRITTMRDLLKTLIDSTSDRRSFDFEKLWQDGDVVGKTFRVWESHPSQAMSEHALIEGLRFEVSNAYLIGGRFWQSSM